VHEAQEHTRADRDYILFIVDVREMDIGVNIICKGLIPNLFGVYMLAEQRKTMDLSHTWKAITNGLEDGSLWEPERKIYGIN
jgi:hypothetical protein